jgi:hypothetical protein
MSPPATQNSAPKAIALNLRNFPMRRMLSRILGTPTTTTRRTSSKKTALQVETLESRWCLSTTVLQSGGLLTITGDNQGDQVKINDNPGANITGVRANGQERLFSGVDRIVVNLKGGKDALEYFQESNRTRSLSLTANLGSDNDFFRSGINGDILNFRALQMHVDGGSGRDTIQVGVFANVQTFGLLNLDLNGGDDNDTVAASYQGKADGLLLINARGGADNDKVLVQVDVAAGSQGRLGNSFFQPATVEGNSGNDDLEFRVHNQTSPNFKVFAKIDGGSNSFFSFFPFGRKDVGRHTANVKSTGLEKDIIVS